MKILIAMDSFKGSVSSLEAGKAVSKGIKKSGLSSHIEIVPVADGGEGTVEAFLYQTDGKTMVKKVTGPLGSDVYAKHGIYKNTAYIEVAETSGITLVKKEELDPFRATTFGLGELIESLINSGYRRFIVGLGGSATNDAGLGMLRALGYRFFTKDGFLIDENICELGNLSKIDDSKVSNKLKECEFIIASDVKNPLIGKNGATAIFGPQKGLKNQDVEKMDRFIHTFGLKSSDYLNNDFIMTPGAGAAGGLGFAFMAYLNATLFSGFDLLVKEKNIINKVKKADIVITGEGRLDAQSVMGKVPSALAELTQETGKILLAICGSVSDDVEECNKYGIDAFFPIIRQIADEKTILSKSNTLISLEQTAEQLGRFYQAIKNK
ncbi:glycerate kinase family protein [Vagococcus sp. JNUCC 83]